MKRIIKNNKRKKVIIGIVIIILLLGIVLLNVLNSLDSLNNKKLEHNPDIENVKEIISASFKSGCEEGCSHTLFYLRDKGNINLSNLSKYPCLEICDLE